MREAFIVAGILAVFGVWAIACAWWSARRQVLEEIEHVDPVEVAILGVVCIALGALVAGGALVIHHLLPWLGGLL